MISQNTIKQEGNLAKIKSILDWCFKTVYFLQKYSINKTSAFALAAKVG